jgi:ribosomal protein S18 acetylase RimI-like enzyme
MRTAQLTSKSAIEEFLRRDPFLHLYELGDLDDFFWPKTTWFGACEESDRGDGAIRHLALLYAAPSLPVLIFLTRTPDDVARTWLASLVDRLPDRFYAHLSPGLEGVFDGAAERTAHGRHLRMALTRPRLDVPGRDEVEPLSPSHRAELEAFYAVAYPRNWFDPRMLETGHYYGLRQDGTLGSVAGIHVYSKALGVAALGNIATLPEHRGRGLARVVTARLCRELLGTVAHVGLNVHGENASAIACYAGLGFETIAEFGEFTIELR